jgi:large subunit ribosomal protein L17
LRSLTLALIENEAIKTTPARAKELRWYADRIVTLAKKGDVASRRRIVQLLGSTETHKPGENRVRNAIERVYNDLVPRFKTRPGGYTQIVLMATRRAGDNAELCVMRYIPGEEKKSGGKATKKDAAPKKKADKVEAAPSDAPKAKKKPEASKAPEGAEGKKSSKAKKKDKEG